ncbi:MAG: phosphoribosylformylglycinamidine synthase, partial [Oscillospiraceae bacterium]
MSVYRIYVEKKPQFAVEAKKVCKDLKTSLQIDSINSVRVINRYDVQGLEEKNYDLASKTVFSEPALDDIYFECPKAANIFAIEYLPGQFDQRADSCAQCIQLLVQGDRPTVKNARIYIVDGEISKEEFEKIKDYLINPVESREASLLPVLTLDTNYEIKTTVKTLDGFIDLSKPELKKFIEDYSLAMDFDDIVFCQEYFALTEKRNPTI